MTSNSLGRPTHFVTLPVQETIVIQIGHETDHPFCCLQAMFAHHNIERGNFYLDLIQSLYFIQVHQTCLLFTFNHSVKILQRPLLLVGNTIKEQKQSQVKINYLDNHLIINKL